MRTIIFTCIAASLVTAPMASIVKAEETTVIKRDRDGDKARCPTQLPLGSLYSSHQDQNNNNDQNDAECPAGIIAPAT